ncbi:ABC transporter ATP-binding/permease protein [Thalassocella blandensis]|nr:ABC transporter ATP-binding/permease protein [Thalassocella blandensis]
MLQIRRKNSDKGPLWLVEQKYTVGNDAKCDIKVTGLTGSEHAHLLVEGDTVVVLNLRKDANIRVNGQVIADRQDVKAGDTLFFAGEEYELIDPKSTIKSSEALVPVQPQGWSLKALNTGLADKQFPITGSHVLGRSKECDICLGVVHLSRQHAKITVTEHGLQVQDLNSSNGTYVNGKKVEAALVHPGDELSFDTLRFRVFGPQLDEDKTMMRPDENLTTIRPAVDVNAGKHANRSSKPSAAKRKPARPSVSAHSNAQVSSHGADSSTSPTEAAKSSNALMLLGGLAVLVGAGLAWFFLK